jgi:hypothetical protein
MSFKAELTVENKTYSLRSFYLVISRLTDPKGRPSSMPSFNIVLTIDSVDDTTITNWMIDPHKQIDGKVLFYKIDEDAKLKEINFKKCWCYVMRDSFMADISFATTEILISGGEVDIESSMLIIS